MFNCNNNTDILEEEEDEGSPCDCCGREYNFNKFVGSCGTHNCKDNMCEDCAHWDEKRSEWFCNKCHDLLVSVNQWDEDYDGIDNCQRCDSDFDYSSYVGNCRSGCFSKICDMCAYCDGENWYCEDCRDKLVEAGEWRDENDMSGEESASDSEESESEDEDEESESDGTNSE